MSSYNYPPARVFVVISTVIFSPGLIYMFAKSMTMDHLYLKIISGFGLVLSAVLLIWFWGQAKEVDNG